MSEIEEEPCCVGLAFITEGETEAIFYLEYLTYICKLYSIEIEKDLCSDDNRYFLRKGQSRAVVYFESTNAISQVINSASWFKSICKSEYSELKWYVYLCYDTDSYEDDISKFQEGDWVNLRNEIQSQGNIEIVDLAAQAEIEDLFLLDIESILTYLDLPSNTPIPNGRKGKKRLKKLFRLSSKGIFYHEGKRSRSLIQCLNMKRIEERAFIPIDGIKEFVKYLDEKADEMVFLK